MRNKGLRGDRSGQDSGQIVVLTALALTALLGIAALSIDASFMYDKRNRLYAAADAAALSGALELHRNSAVSQASLEAFANAAVLSHGFSPGGTTSVVVNHPPSSGPYAGNSSFVQVIVSEPTATFFGRVLGWTSMTPGAGAVAGTGSNPANCIVTTQPPGVTPTSLDFGNTQFTLNGCGIGDSGDLSGSNPNAAVTGTPTPPVSVSGTCSGTCSGMGTLSQGAPPPTDPLAGLPIPTNPYGSCSAGTAATLSPGCYTSIADTVTQLTGGGLNNGLYYITGKVDIGNLTGSGVTLFLTGSGQLTARNNNEIHLTAPTSGTYTGIAIFQDPSDSNNLDSKNSLTVDVTGAIYMPGTDIDSKNHIDFSLTNCTLLVSHSLYVKNGSGSFSTSNCAALFGGAIFLKVAIVQ